jgi:hypothetical protein
MRANAIRTITGVVRQANTPIVVTSADIIGTARTVTTALIIAGCFYANQTAKCNNQNLENFHG